MLVYFYRRYRLSDYIKLKEKFNFVFWILLITTLVTYYYNNMAINKKLIHFQNKSTFNAQLKAGNLKDTSIVFIKDTQEIWTHGQLYSKNELQEALQNLSNNVIILLVKSF